MCSWLVCWLEHDDKRSWLYCACILSWDHFEVMLLLCSVMPVSLGVWGMWRICESVGTRIWEIPRNLSHGLACLLCREGPLSGKRKCRELSSQVQRYTSVIAHERLVCESSHNHTCEKITTWNVIETQDSYGTPRWTRSQRPRFFLEASSPQVT
jgi:hypothetical protein